MTPQHAVRPAAGPTQSLPPTTCQPSLLPQPSRALAQAHPGRDPDYSVCSVGDHSPAPGFRETGNGVNWHTREIGDFRRPKCENDCQGVVTASGF